MTGFEYEDRLEITTPEGVDLTLTLAGVGSRFLAAVLDAIVEAVVLGALAVLIFATSGFGAGTNAATTIFVVVFFIVFWGYDVVFEVLASGRTPGKRWNGLRVVREGGQPIGFLASATRNLLRIIDWLPSAYLVGIAAILVSSRNQRLGDLVAGTIVVRERRDGGAFPVPRAPAAHPLPGEALWDTSMVSTEELAAVRSFLERRSGIEPNARYELAATLAQRLAPKVAGVPEGTHPEAFLERLLATRDARGELPSRSSW